MNEPVIEQGLTQERVDLLSSKEISLSDLNPTELNDFRAAAANGGTLERPDIVEPVAATPEPEFEPVVEPTKQELFDISVKANQAKQKYEAKVKENSKWQTKIDALKGKEITKATDDHFDDASQQNVKDRLTMLQETVDTLISEREAMNNEFQSKFQAEYQTLENNKHTVSMHNLQKSFPDLNTTIPVNKLNDELTAFSESVGGFDNVNKYLEDETYKKQIDESGIKTLSTDFVNNLDKFNKIVDLNNKFAVEKDANGLTYKDRNPDTNINSFYMNQLHESGEFDKQLANAKLTGATQVVNKVVNQKHAATLMKPASGGATPAAGMTIEMASSILSRIRAKGGALTDQDKDDQRKVREFIAENAK